MAATPENLYFDVYPKIVRAGAGAEITIKPLFDHCRFDENATYDVT